MSSREDTGTHGLDAAPSAINTMTSMWASASGARAGCPLVCTGGAQGNAVSGARGQRQAVRASRVVPEPQADAAFGQADAIPGRCIKVGDGTLVRGVDLCERESRRQRVNNRGVHVLAWASSTQGHDAEACARARTHGHPQALGSPCGGAASSSPRPALLSPTTTVVALSHSEKGRTEPSACTSDIRSYMSPRLALPWPSTVHSSPERMPRPRTSVCVVWPAMVSD